jgi:hypothetical protein
MVLRTRPERELTLGELRSGILMRDGLRRSDHDEGYEEEEKRDDRERETIRTVDAELGHRLLNNATTNTHAAHQSPIALNLAVLANRGVAQIHAPNQI